MSPDRDRHSLDGHQRVEAQDKESLREVVEEQRRLDSNHDLGEGQQAGPQEADLACGLRVGKARDRLGLPDNQGREEQPMSRSYDPGEETRETEYRDQGQMDQEESRTDEP